MVSGRHTMKFINLRPSKENIIRSMSFMTWNDDLVKLALLQDERCHPVSKTYHLQARNFNWVLCHMLLRDSYHLEGRKWHNIQKGHWIYYPTPQFHIMYISTDIESVVVLQMCLHILLRRWLGHLHILPSRVGALSNFWIESPRACLLAQWLSQYGKAWSGSNSNWSQNFLNS